MVIDLWSKRPVARQKCRAESPKQRGGQTVFNQDALLKIAIDRYYGIGQVRVAEQKPTAWSDAVGFVLELFRPKFSEVFEAVSKEDLQRNEEIAPRLNSASRPRPTTKRIMDPDGTQENVGRKVKVVLSRIREYGADLSNTCNAFPVAK
ncbi:hypothetical protein T265_00888 [Opisthorchis viverrini]|uniref:Uncharacterized protein n=1 Tax=Opisthorchis viverrini TaxID=6198 RepID=A0A075AJD4_OPIVI|nr:hypothetical protein T265_00888 [Opisthorchis viverrini]KER33189.1 hypothetical protein T265_00888 [Opisthorchis viverrini]